MKAARISPASCLLTFENSSHTQKTNHEAVYVAREVTGGHNKDLDPRWIREDSLE